MGKEVTEGFTQDAQAISPLVVPARTGADTGTDTGTGSRIRARRFAPTATSEPTRTEAERATRTRIKTPTAPVVEIQQDDAETPQVTKPVRATRTSKKEIAKKQISMLLDVTNNIAAGVAGPQAVMRQYEREMIEYPLWSYAESHTATVGKAADAAAPLVCVVGVSLWLRRVLQASGVSLPKPATKKPKPNPANAPAYYPPESQRVQTVEQPPQPEPPVPNGRAVSVDDIRRMTVIGES